MATKPTEVVKVQGHGPIIPGKNGSGEVYYCMVVEGEDKVYLLAMDIDTVHELYHTFDEFH